MPEEAGRATGGDRPTRSERDRTIVRLALPALGSLAIEPLYVLVDTGIVGHLGTGPLGGLALASTVLVTSMWIFNFLAYGTTGRVAFLRGRGDERGAASVAVQGLWLCILTGSLSVAALVLVGRPVARALGGQGDVLRAATTYLRISAIGIPFVLVTLVGNGYLRGVHDTRTPLVIVAASNVANVVLEIWFVYGLHAGVAGSAWGTVVAQIGAALGFGVLIVRAARRTGAGFGLDRAELVRLGTAARQLGVRTGALLLGLAATTSVAARLGTATLGGHQIAFQIHNLLALALDAFAIAGQAMVGSALGARHPDEARAIANRLLRLGFLTGIAFAAVLLATSGVVPAIFTSDAAVRHQARVALAVVAIVQLPSSIVFVLDGVLIGAGDLGYQQWAMTVVLAVYLPALWVVLHFRLGIAALWIAVGWWLLARLVANVTRFAGARWTASATR